VPGTGASDYLALGKLLSGKPGQTVGDRVPTTGPLWDRMLDPVLLAILNTAPAIGSAELTAAVVRRSLALGSKASLPRIASPTLAAAFIDPATAWLEAHGAPVALGRRLRSIEAAGDRVTALDWGAGPEPVATDEAVVLAVPSWVAKGLLPKSACPTRSIRSSTPISRSRRRRGPLMLGLLGATGQWLFAFEDRISVTVSAADDIVDHDREELAYRFWDEIQRAYGFSAPMPAWQIVKEKRATFSATPEQDAKRPPARTRWRNLFLAGDWTATGLPATIEGALRSGETAARTVLARRNKEERA
jgi:hypothetical protein